jgi:hypothetical protein
MWEVEYYETRRGECPVQDFMDYLDNRAKAKIARTIDLLGKFGIHLGRPYVEHVEGKLRELRTRVGTNRYRIIYFLLTARYSFCYTDL